MRVLAIGDIHCPAEHPGYIHFCADLYDQWNCNKVVFIGDVLDHHAISFHAANPHCPGPDDEFLLAYESVQKWYEMFEEADVCIGNHDARPLRLAESVKMPARYIKTFSETWGTDGWNWDHEHVIDEVSYLHGTGFTGVHPAWNAITKKMSSVVMGHCHSRGGVKWMATRQKRFFGMDTGCGICPDAWQFAYGKDLPIRPFISAGVVIDGIPYFEPMPCGSKEKYHRSNF